MQSKGLSDFLKHPSSKASILQCSAFSTVQLSHPHVTAGKTIALTRQSFVDKVILRREFISILKSRDITLLTKVCIVKAMVFPAVTYVCEKLADEEG